MPSRFTGDNSILVLHEFPFSHVDMDNEAQVLFLKISQVIHLITHYLLSFQVILYYLI